MVKLFINLADFFFVKVKQDMKCRSLSVHDKVHLGSYHFLLGWGGGRLFVIASRHFFWSPPWRARKNFGPPLGIRKKIMVPPLGLSKKILVPPPP